MDASLDRVSIILPSNELSMRSQVAIKTFVDAFSTLIIEDQLLQKLPSLLTPESVVSLDDDTVRTIAAEPHEMTSERSQTEVKLKSLQKALSLLQTLERSKQRGQSPHPSVVLSLD